MKVYELKIKVYLTENIQYDYVYDKISYLIDSCLILDEKYEELHKENKFKNYCFSSFYPLESEKVYKKDNIYTISLRTIDSALAEYLVKNMQNHYTSEIKVLVIDIKEIKMKPIEKIYSLTPAILKTENGYWRGELSLEEFEERIKINLIKKYNDFVGTKINEDFELQTGIKFINKKPVSIKYKNVKLLGDKIELNISSDSEAQKLAFMALGTGILEMNPRGAGYVNVKFIK